jgi:hypothetical protein
MARIQNIATTRFADLLRADEGLAAVYREVEAADGAAATIPAVLEQFVSADVAEKAAAVKYPVIHVYCDKLVNKFREKFRSVSGTVSLVAEIRVSSDHLQDLQQVLALHVDVVTEVLHRRRGDWGDGIFYAGEYEIAFQPIRRGGRNYLQSALITLEAHISA